MEDEERRKSLICAPITLFVLDTPGVSISALGSHQATGSLPVLMGIPPPRLHYGPAANYGSIIILCICHRRLREQPGFCV